MLLTQTLILLLLMLLLLLLLVQLLLRAGERKASVRTKSLMLPFLRLITTTSRRRLVAVPRSRWRLSALITITIALHSVTVTMVMRL